VVIDKVSKKQKSKTMKQADITEGSKMTELLKKPTVQLAIQAGMMTILVLVLVGGYYLIEGVLISADDRQDKMMSIFIDQQKEDTSAKIELAKALQELTGAIKNK